MNAPARFDWKDAAGMFTATELQVIALAAGAPGACEECGDASPRGRGLWRRLRGLFALYTPAPLADPRLEALRRLACNDFAARARKPALREAALAAGVSAEQIDRLAGIAARWRGRR